MGATLGPDVRDEPDRAVSAPALPLYLVRHCQATGQEPDAPLTPAGAAQAERLADLLESHGITRIVSSPYARAIQSIVPLAERLRIAVETDDRLIERMLSATPMSDWRDHLRVSFADLDYRIGDGESSRSAMARAIAALDTARRRAHGPVAIVTHGNLLALLLRQIDGRCGFPEWERFTNPDVYRITASHVPQPIERLWT